VVSGIAGDATSSGTGTGRAMNLIKHVAEGFSLARDVMAKRSTDRRYQLLADYFQTAYERKEHGEPLAWVNFATIPELFRAMDLMPVYIDALIGTAAGFSKEGITRYVDIGERDIPDHICATNKAFLGAIIDGDLPVPDLLVNAGHPCDSNLATYPVIAEKFGFPYFCIDAPYWRNERAMEHLVGELERLISFLEGTTKRKLDFAKLQRIMEYSNRAHEYILRINGLKMAVPAPCRGADTSSDYLLSLCLAGTEDFGDYCAERYGELAAAVERRQGALTEERMRLAWIFGAPSFDISVFGWLEKEYGAVSMHMPGNMQVRPVEDISSTASILRGLAEKLISLPMGNECGGPWEHFADAVVRFCADFKADAAIFLNNVGCQHNWPIARLTRDTIYDELGIQTLIIEADFFDPRRTSSEAIKERIREFLSVILGA
jgi:benzoyl-CoA reductase/2-hydroxyglutaryl-CoA dehydratase subunit BcrC/BadD/HgdB